MLTPSTPRALGTRAATALAVALVALWIAPAAEAAPGPGAPRAEWRQFRLRADHNAVLPGTLRVSWRTRIGGPVSSSPAVSGSTLFIGDNSGRMSAIDVRTGTVRWTRTLENPIMTSPIVAGGDVIVGEGNAETYVHRGVVHVGSGTSAIVAFDRTTGRTRWIQPLAGTGMPTPALVDGSLIEHDGNGEIVALDPATGAVRYVAQIGTIASMSAIVPIGGAHFATSGQTETAVRAVAAADGTVAWSRPMPGASGIGDCPLVLAPGPILVGDYLKTIGDEPYVRAGRPNQERAYALDPATGNVRWDVALETGIVPARNQSAIPIADGATIFLGSSVANVMHALDAASGRLLWRRTLDAPVKGAGVAMGGVLYVGDGSGSLWALAERDGRVLGRDRVGYAFDVGSPIVVGRTLLVGAGAGELLALPLDLLRASTRQLAIRSDEARYLSGATLAWFRSLDRNNDGAIERWEFARAVAHGRARPGGFALLDRDRDGLVAPKDVAREPRIAVTR